MFDCAQMKVLFEQGAILTGSHNVVPEYRGAEKI